MCYFIIKGAGGIRLQYYLFHIFCRPYSIKLPLDSMAASRWPRNRPHVFVIDSLVKSLKALVTLAFNSSFVLQLILLGFLSTALHTQKLRGASHTNNIIISLKIQVKCDQQSSMAARPGFFGWHGRAPNLAGTRTASL